MAGVYGTVRPANLNPLKDVEIFYHYRPTRSTEDDDFVHFKTLDPSCLVEATGEEGESTFQIGGLYTLRLPLDKFNMKGFYTVYIRPKEEKVEIADVSVLAAYPDIKGVVFNLSGLSESDLTGYRIEYYDEGKKTDITRLITSSNRCEPVLVTVTDSYPKVTRYRLVNTASNLIFCTVTPSSSSSYNPNSSPYIGVAGGEVRVINTKFNPVLIEIEMVEHDADTLTYMVEGDQICNRDNNIITTYNEDKEIYHQADYYTVKSRLGKALYDVKKKRTNIDGSQTYDNLIIDE